MRKIEMIEKKCWLYFIPLIRPWKYIEFWEAKDSLKLEMNCAPHLMFNEIQKQLDKTEKFLDQQSDHIRSIDANFKKLIRFKLIMQSSIQFIKTLQLKSNSILKMMGGMISIQEIDRFWKLMYWATHGNTLIHFIPVDGDEKDELVLGDVQKMRIFLIMHQESANLERIVSKVINSFKTSTVQEIPPIE